MLKINEADVAAERPLPPEIVRHAVGQDDIPLTGAAGLPSSVEDRWRQAAKAAGKGADLDALRAVDPDLVEHESWLLGSALRQVAGELPEDGRGFPLCANCQSPECGTPRIRVCCDDCTHGI